MNMTLEQGRAYTQEIENKNKKINSSVIKQLIIDAFLPQTGVEGKVDRRVKDPTDLAKILFHMKDPNLLVPIITSVLQPAGIVVLIKELLKNEEKDTFLRGEPLAYKLMIELMGSDREDFQKGLDEQLDTFYDFCQQNKNIIRRQKGNFYFSTTGTEMTPDMIAYPLRDMARQYIRVPVSDGVKTICGVLKKVLEEDFNYSKEETLERIYGFISLRLFGPNIIEKFGSDKYKNHKDALLLLSKLLQSFLIATGSKPTDKLADWPDELKDLLFKDKDLLREEVFENIRNWISSTSVPGLNDKKGFLKKGFGVTNIGKKHSKISESTRKIKRKTLEMLNTTLGKNKKVIHSSTEITRNIGGTSKGIERILAGQRAERKKEDNLLAREEILSRLSASKLQSGGGEEKLIIKVHMEKGNEKRITEQEVWNIINAYSNPAQVDQLFSLSSYSPFLPSEEGEDFTGFSVRTTPKMGEKQISFSSLTNEFTIPYGKGYTRNDLDVVSKLAKEMGYKPLNISSIKGPELTRLAIDQIKRRELTPIGYGQRLKKPSLSRSD